jgi:DNA-binding NarL/FixJ family response regulator
MIRVLLADDQEVVRTGVRTILESQDDIEIIGEAADGRTAVELVQRLVPDVLVADIRMPLLDGIEATRRVTAAALSTRVLVLTTYGLDEYVYDALKAGAAGFLLKIDPPARLIDGVRVVAAGESLLAPEITRRLIGRFVAMAPPASQPPGLSQLTPKEREVLLTIAEGLSNAEIAERLYVSPGTVKTHVNRVLAKLDLRDRVQAVVFAYEHRLVGTGSEHGTAPDSSERP